MNRLKKISYDNKLGSELLGKPVKIQVFRRDGVRSDSIDLETMQIYVGVLEAYFQDNNTTGIKLKGLAVVHIDRDLKYFEAFTLDAKV